MVRKLLLLSIMLLLVSLPMFGCGVPKEDYEAVVAERNSVQAELQSTRGELQSVSSELETKKTELQTTQGELETTKSELQSVKDELDTVKSRLTSTQSDLSRKNSLYSSLRKKLALGEQVNTFQRATYRAPRAKSEGNQEELESQTLLGLSIFKSYDPLVKGIGDLELSRLWVQAWPEASRAKSEQDKEVWYNFSAYANFLDRLSVLTGSDIDKL